MSVAHARTFIRRAMREDDLRRQLNGAPTLSAMEEILATEGIPFAAEHFESAFTGLKVKCQTPNEVEALTAIRQWWEALLLYTIRENGGDVVTG